MTRGLNVRQTKVRRLKEHAKVSTTHPTGARLRASITIRVSYNCLLIMRASHRSSYSHTRLYKGDLTSPSRYD